MNASSSRLEYIACKKKRRKKIRLLVFREREREIETSKRSESKKQGTKNSDCACRGGEQSKKTRSKYIDFCTQKCVSDNNFFCVEHLKYEGVLCGSKQKLVIRRTNKHLERILFFFIEIGKRGEREITSTYLTTNSKGGGQKSAIRLAARSTGK